MQDVEIGFTGVTTYNPTVTYLTQTIGIGTYSSGVIWLGGQQSQVNIGSGPGPTPNPSGGPVTAAPTAGATGTVNLGANSPTPSAQAINIGPTTTGTITVGGVGSVVNIASGSTAGPTTAIVIGVNGGTPSAQPIKIGASSSNTVQIGGTDTTVRLSAQSGATGQILIGANSVPTPSAQPIQIGVTSTSTIIVGGTGTSVQMGLNVVSPATYSIASGTSTAPVTLGASSSASQTVNIAPATSGTITIGGGSSNIAIAPALGPNTKSITIGSGAATAPITLGSSTSSSQAINIAPTTTGTITVGGTGSTVTIASGAATGPVTLGANSAASQAINIAPSTTGTIQVGGSGSTISIGGTTAPATASTLTLNGVYPNNYAMFKVSSGTAPAQYPNSVAYNTLIGWPYTTAPAPIPASGTNINAYTAPSPVQTVLTPCPSPLPSAGFPTSPAGAFAYTQNLDCINIKQPGIYRVCTGGLSLSAGTLNTISLYRLSCGSQAPTSFVLMGCGTGQSPAPCPSAPLASPSPTFSNTFSPTTTGTSACAFDRTVMWTGVSATYGLSVCTDITAPSGPTTGPTADITRAPVMYGIAMVVNGPTVATITQGSTPGFVSVQMLQPL